MLRKCSSNKSRVKLRCVEPHCVSRYLSVSHLALIVVVIRLHELTLECCYANRLLYSSFLAVHFPLSDPGVGGLLLHPPSISLQSSLVCACTELWSQEENSP